MYRLLMCTCTILAIGALSACGQSGTLMLPSDPNYDKRSQYLLYPNVEQKTVPTSESTEQTSSSSEQN